MANLSSSEPSRLKLVKTICPPSQATAWQSAPHSTLPIIATCFSDKTVKIFSLDNPGTPISTIEGGHKRSIRTCAWKPNLKRESTIATGSFDANVGIWRKSDIEDQSHQNSSGFDGKDFMNTNGGENTDEEDPEDWRYALVLEGHESEIKCVSWSAGGNLLATCSRDKSVWIWEEVGDDDFETVAVLQEHEADVKCVQWHPEEELLASASYDDTIRLWREDVDDWVCVAVLRGHEGTVWAVEWEKSKESLDPVASDPVDGPRLASCSDDRTIRIWKRQPKEKGPEQSKFSIIRSSSIEEDWQEVSRLPEVHARSIYSVAWSKASGRIVSTGGDGKILVYEEKDGEWIIVAQVDEAHEVAEINHVCWLAKKDGTESILSTGEDGAVRLWEMNG